MLNRRSRPRKLRQEGRFWDESGRNPAALGCTLCRELQLCGGIHTSSGAFDCVSFCCRTPDTCDMVCLRNPGFARRLHEVGGLSLDNIPRAPRHEFTAMPPSVPFVYHRSRRTEPFAPTAVALSLYSLLDRRSGASRFNDRKSLCDYFMISELSTIVLSGTAEDGPLERWWGLGHRRREVLKSLRDLGITIATTPNFSLFSNVPRWDNLHSMKRIAICWEEFASAGLATALHVNARTAEDWRRWTEFVRARPEITGLSYEFATGAVGKYRMGWHADSLAYLAESVDRPLAVLVRGGLAVLSELRSTFHAVTLLDTTSFMKTVNRKSGYWSKAGRLGWRDATGTMQYRLEQLLEHNYLTVLKAASSRVV